jgi:hypothetical protein
MVPLKKNSNGMVSLDTPPFSRPSLSMSLSLEHGPETTSILAAQQEDNIGLYNTTTDGSKHCVFDPTNHHSHSLLRTTAPSERDPTIMLTSPQKLPKSILHRPRDALCIPHNQLMENRKTKKRETAGHASKTVVGVVAQGSHFMHQDTILAQKIKDEEELKKKSRKKEKKRLRNYKKAKRRFENKATVKEDRRMLSLSINKNTSRPGTATSHTSHASGTTAATVNTATSADTRGTRGTRGTAGSVHATKMLPTSTRPPPPGWQEHLDPVTGDTFYVHLKSKRTTWEYPEKGRSIPSRGLAKGVEVQMSEPQKKARVKQDWTEYLPEPSPYQNFSW